MEKPVIAIDGPAGAGKSTVARALANYLNLRYLDTGAMYRAFALRLHRLEQLEAEDLVAAFGEARISFGTGTPPPVFLDVEDVSEAIRMPEIGELASRLSAIREVRVLLLRQQQEIVADGGVVLEGRDATTVIAPNANLKIYMTASLEERARRRSREFSAKGLEEDFRDVRSQIEQRDHRDINRQDSPLTVAPDAEIIETGGKSIDAVINEIVELLHQRVGGHGRTDV